MTLLISLLACGEEEPTTPQPEATPAVPKDEGPAVIADEGEQTPPDAEATTLPATGQVTVGTIKNGEVPVTGEFVHVEGGLQIVDSSWTNASGTIRVRLDSWNSGDLVRDQRVRGTFFQVSPDNATADFELESVVGVPEGGFTVGGQPRPVTLHGKLTLHGATVDAAFPVNVERPLEQAWVLTSPEPVNLSIEGFGMGEQLAALMTECGHKSVDDNVSVTLHVELGEIPKAEPATEAGPEGGEAEGAAGQ